MAAANKRAAQLLYPGVNSATLVGVKYSTSSLDKSYASKDDWHDPEAVAEGTRPLLGILSSLLTGTCWCLAHLHSPHTSARHLVLGNIGCLVLMINILPLSPFQNDRNFWKGLRTCAEMTAYSLFQSLQRNIWTASAELTSQQRTSLPSIETLSRPKLA